MTGFMHDVRYALRTLAGNPASSCTAIVVLALAIGASTAVFAVVDTVLGRPLLIDDPDRVVVIWPRERANPTTIGEISHWTFRSWQSHAQSFESLAAIGSVNWSLLLRTGGESTTLPVAAVSASFFELIRTRPQLGRVLAPQDDQKGAADVAVMSHRSWMSRFAGDPLIIGRQLLLGGKPYTVVGVMPDGFDYPRGVDLWVPVVPRLVDAAQTWRIDTMGSPWFGVLFVMGRVRQNVTIEQARAEVSALISRNAGDAFSPGMEAVLTPVREHIFGKTRPALVGLAVTVGFVLIIACANVTTLQLVRTAGRSHDRAIRAAMGASHWRLVRESLTHAFALSIVAGVSGLLIARWTLSVLVRLAPNDMPRMDIVRFDGRGVLFALVASVLAAGLAGVVPALYPPRHNVADALRAGNTKVTRSRKLRQAFVVAQIAIAMTLLVTGGLVGRSFVNVTRLDFGFDPSNVLTLAVTVPDMPLQRRSAFYAALLERVRRLPGVDAAGAIFLRPLEHAGIGTDASILLEGQRVEDMKRNPGANYEAITPGYFEAMGMRVLRGRAFTEADDGRGQQVVIVSEGMARRFWPGEDAIGKRLVRPGAPTDSSGNAVFSTVVGVVADARYRGLSDVRFDLYVPYLQNPNDPVKHLMVRSTSEPFGLARTIRAEALRLEPSALVEGVTTMDTIVGDATAPWRFGASTIGFLSGLATLIAALGVYGIVKQSVVERTREIAVRMALGAPSRAIVILVFAEALLVVTVGIAIGLLAAGATSALVTGLLFGMQRFDPLTFGAMAALFGTVALIAACLPALRAARVDPHVILQHQ